MSPVILCGSHFSSSRFVHGVSVVRAARYVTYLQRVATCIHAEHQQTPSNCLHCYFSVSRSVAFFLVQLNFQVKILTFVQLVHLLLLLLLLSFGGTRGHSGTEPPKRTSVSELSF